MKKLLSGFVFVAALMAACTLHAQIAPSIEWETSFGGSAIDMPNYIQQTTDGGFIVVGQSASNDGDLSINYGGLDYWIVKLDSIGNLVWQKSYGGSGDDAAYSAQQTSDGGFIIAGFSMSNDGDVTGNHGLQDCWIVKLDTVGNMVWQKSYGGSQLDWATSIHQTTNGGFIVAGYSYSDDGDVTGHHGSTAHSDYWILMLDSAGNLISEKSFGGGSWDDAYSIQQTSDGGFIVAGYANSSNGDVSGNHGDYDFWIVKLDEVGHFVWQKCLGGTSTDWASSIHQTIDGGYIVAGRSTSYDGDVTGNHGGMFFGDDWVLKLDSAGNLIWEKCLGGTNEDYALSVIETSDGGFMVAGTAASNDGDVSGNHSWSGFDAWIVQLDESGYLEWQKCLGGSSADYAFSIQQISDGFIVAGPASSTDGDVTGNHGDYDFWIVKLANDTATGILSPSTNFISLHPNPVQNILTIDLARQAANETIRVYDPQGRKIILPITITNTQAQLNTTTLPDGIYILQITDNKTVKTEVSKFVKAK